MKNLKHLALLLSFAAAATAIPTHAADEYDEDPQQDEATVENQGSSCDGLVKGLISGAVGTVLFVYFASVGVGLYKKQGFLNALNPAYGFRNQMVDALNLIFSDEKDNIEKGNKFEPAKKLVDAMAASSDKAKQKELIEAFGGKLAEKKPEK